MYEIIKNDDNTSLGLIDQPRFVKVHDNGCFISCDENLAQGIAINGIVYQLCGKKKLDGEHIEVVAIKRNSGNILMSINNIQNDTDALIVDQEYRLTLLELGVTE